MKKKKNTVLVPWNTNFKIKEYFIFGAFYKSLTSAWVL